MVNKICEVCGTQFQVKSYDLNRGRGKYCSQSCGAKASVNARNRNNGDIAYCAVCNKQFPKSSFGFRYNSGVRYNRYICQQCKGVYKKRYRRAYPIIHLLGDARKRCKKSGIEFSLTKEDLVMPEFCPVFGVRLEVGGKKGESLISDNSPTIDRLDPSKGYVKDNVAIISWRANRLKSNGSAEEHEKIVDYIRNFNNERSYEDRIRMKQLKELKDRGLLNI